MLKKDYLLEMIGTISRAISQILFQKSQKEYVTCHRIAEDAYQELMGMPLSMILSLPESTIFDFLSTFGELDPEKVFLLADLLKTDAEVFSAEEDGAMAQAVFDKCGALLEALEDDALTPEQSEALASRKAALA